MYTELGGANKHIGTNKASSSSRPFNPSRRHQTINNQAGLQPDDLEMIKCIENDLNPIGVINMLIGADELSWQQVVDQLSSQ